MIFYFNYKSRVYLFINVLGWLFLYYVKLILHTCLFEKNKFHHGKCLVVSFKAVFSANSFTPTCVLV